MNRTEKEQIIEDLRGELGSAASILITDLSGVEVNTINELRSQLRAKGVKYRVAKNSLIKRAIAGTDAEAMAPLLVGPTALAWHDEEPAVAAKIVKDFVKDAKNFDVKGGYIDGDIMKGEEALKMADLPSKDQLRAQVLGLVKMVPGKFLALMETAPRKFYAVLEAYKAKQEEEGEAA